MCLFTKVDNHIESNSNRLIVFIKKSNDKRVQYVTTWNLCVLVKDSPVMLIAAHCKENHQQVA